jgi:hypothetical protein
MFLNRTKQEALPENNGISTMRQTTEAEAERKKEKDDRRRRRKE